MSPFANTPELWLTAHLHRQKQQEHIVKIQAVVKGFLVRRKTNVHLRLSIPPPQTLQSLMLKHGLQPWADLMPSAKEAVLDEEASKKRQEYLFHATMTLRLLGKVRFVQDLEWADYHERAKAMHELYDVGSPVETLWKKFKKAFCI